MNTTQVVQIPEPRLSRLLFANTKFSWVWLVIRLYVGYEWLMAGWSKVTSSLWVGHDAGGAVTGFLQGALAKTGGAHPDVSGWYAWFIQNVALPHAFFLSHVVAVGELLVGVALVLGIFTGVAAFFGSFMNMNYLFAGTVSSNPVLFILQLFLILGWRTAGWIGLDRWLLPKLGTPWTTGELFETPTKIL